MMKQTCCRVVSSLLFHNPFSTSSSHFNETVITISNSLKQGLNWDSLSHKFSSAQLTKSIIEQVLLTLKEPSNSKRALWFFHWSAFHNGNHHQISNYAITIHILAKGNLIKDTHALLHSALTKILSGNFDNFLFVDSMISSYDAVDSVPLVFDLLIQSYAKLRMIELGLDVCLYLSEKGFTCSVITYITLLRVVQKSENPNLVWKIYELMIRNRTCPNEATIRIMISALCKEGKLQEYIDMLDRINGERNSPPRIVNASLVFRVLNEERVEEGMLLMKRMLEKGMILDTISYSFIIYSRIKFSSLESAHGVYEEMLNRGFRANSFLCTLFIEAYCKDGKIEDAIRSMQEMCDMGLKPYGETFDHLIVGCSKVKNLEESMRFCKEMMEMGFLPRCSAFNEMLYKLCENKRVREADDLLTSLLDKGFKPDEITYARLIDGYAKDGKIQDALKLYYEMDFKKISPSKLVFESLITSLCACGKLDEAKKYLKVMEERSMIPSRYICEAMVDGHHTKGNITMDFHIYGEMDGK